MFGSTTTCGESRKNFRLLRSSQQLTLRTTSSPTLKRMKLAAVVGLAPIPAVRRNQPSALESQLIAAQQQPSNWRDKVGGAIQLCAVDPRLIIPEYGTFIAAEFDRLRYPQARGFLWPHSKGSMETDVRIQYHCEEANEIQTDGVCVGRNGDIQDRSPDSTASRALSQAWELRLSPSHSIAVLSTSSSETSIITRGTARKSIINGLSRVCS